MKTIKLRSAIYLALFLLLAISCKQDDLNKPLNGNSNAPGVVTGVKVTNLNGKVKLTYSLPNDKDLLYVKAIYETAPGKSREVKASHYTNTLTIDGFGDTLTHTVKLYAVNSSEVISAPVNVTVQPLAPSVDLAFKSLKVTVTFGGFNIVCNNPTLENLAIIPLVDTAGKGVWVQPIGMDNIYSNGLVISSAVRGQPAIARKYAFVVRDRWLNFSDTLFTSLTPLFEQMLPKSKWSNYVLPGDAKTLYDFTSVRNIFDNNINSGWPNVLFTEESAGSPQTVTLDLGNGHILSRLKLNGFKELGDVYYARGNLKDFEVWGSNNPNLNGTYDGSWTKLVTCNVIKPSGSPTGTETAADQAYGFKGWEFDFPTSQTPYRYIRIRSLKNWSGSFFMSMSEFTLWGN